MAFDAHGRLAILGMTAAMTLPVPDGALTVRDRAQYLGLPNAVTASFPGPAPTPATGMRQIIPWATESALGDGYFDLLSAAAGTASSSPTVVPCTGVLRHLRVEAPITPGPGAGWICTVYRNGLATSMAATITDTNNPATSLPDLSVSEGDRIELRTQPIGSPTGSNGFRVSVEFESATAGQSLYTGRAGGGFASGTQTRRTGVFRIGPWTDAAIDVARLHSVAAASGAITKVFFIAYGGAGTFGSDTLTIHVWKNGVKQDGSGGTVDTGVVLTGSDGFSSAKSQAFTLPISPGDTCYLEGVWSSTGGSPAVVPGVQFTATTNGESQFCGFSGSLSVGDGSSEFAPPNAQAHGWGTETGINRIDGGLLTSFGLKHLFMVLTAAPGSGNTREFRPRLNGANPAGGQVVTIADTDTTGADTSGTFQVDPGDLVSFRHIPTSFPTGAFAAWGMIQVTAAASVPPTFPPPTAPNPPVGDPVGVVRVARFVLGLQGSPAQQIEFAAEATIRDPAGLWDGKKPSGLLSVSRHERVLAYEGIPRARCTVTVDDTPDPVTGLMRWRGLSFTHTLEGTYVELNDHHAPYGITIGTPWRWFAGRVTEHRPLEGFRYEFTLEDDVGGLFSDPERQPTIPGQPLSLAEFAGMNPDFDGKYAPRVLGAAVEDGEGVVPMIVMGRLNPFLAWGAGVNQELGVGLIAQGAVYDVVEGYYSLLTWTPDTAVPIGEERIPATPDGFYYRVTTAGTTGSTEPSPWTAPTTSDGTVTWTRVGPYDATIRNRIPASAYGVALVVPHKPGWTAITGLSDQYVLYGSPTRAWTPVFWDLSHPYSPFVEKGQITLVFDVVGAMNSPLSGTPILDHVELWAYMLLNLLWHDTDGQTYGNMPLLPGQTGDYAAIDLQTVTDAKALGDALGGFVAGFVLAALGEAEDGWQRLASLPRDGIFRVGTNRHGQAIVARRNPNATATIVFDEVRDHIQYEQWVSKDRRGIGVEFEFGVRYVDSTPPPAAQSGQPAVLTGGRQPGPWASGLNRLPHTAAQAAHDASRGRAVVEPIVLEMDTIRDPATAQIVAEQRKDEGAGPGPAYDGIRMFRITGDWDRVLKRLGTDGKPVDLNSYISVTSSEGMTAVGYTLQLGWVTKIAPDPDAHRCVIEGEILGPPFVAVP